MLSFAAGGKIILSGASRLASRSGRCDFAQRLVMAFADIEPIAPENVHTGGACDRCQSRRGHSGTAFANGTASWLLMANDRIKGEHDPLTHEFLAPMLGVRRSGVTVALNFLE